MPIPSDIRKNKIKKFIRFLQENQIESAVEELEEIFLELDNDQKDFTKKSEIKELIIELREHFKLIDERFIFMDKRFEELIHQIDKRFDAIDKRFQDLIHYMDKRFEELIHQIDKRFGSIDKRFEELIHQIDKRFGSMDKRFEELIHQIDKRFDAMDKHFEEIEKRFNYIQWMIGLLFTGLIFIISFFQYLNHQSNLEMIKILNQIDKKIEQLNK
jgi:DNA-binding ferritin-like protein